MVFFFFVVVFGVTVSSTRDYWILRDRPVRNQSSDNDRWCSPLAANIYTNDYVLKCLQKQCPSTTTRFQWYSRPSYWFVHLLEQQLLLLYTYVSNISPFHLLVPLVVS